MRRALLMLALVAMTPVSADTPESEPATRVDTRPTPEDPLHLHLNDPVGRPAPSESCEAALCSSLLALIEGAERSIDFAIYGIRGQPAIFDALVAAKKRGVTVRGVIDRTVDGRNYYADSEALVKALGNVRDDLSADKRSEAEQGTAFDGMVSKCNWPQPEGFEGPKQCIGYSIDGDRCVIAALASREPLTFQGDIMHNKYFVVDGTYVWMGSTNVSDSGTGGYNANLVAVLNSRPVASWYTREFEQMWSDRYHEEKQSHRPLTTTLAGDIRVDGFFSPQDRPMTSAVRPVLQRARERIDVAIFFLTHKGVAKDLIDAHRRGVQVRVIMDATAAKNGYAKHEMLRAAGVPVKIENWGGKMHMKAAAIDGRTVITGSMNWTSAGENGNDENTLVIESPAHAQQFHDYYDGIWTAIPDRWLEGRPDPESKDSTTACTDGSDNDFDKLRDDEDPGCSDEPPTMPALPPYLIVPKEEGYKLIKGNISRDGKRTYHLFGPRSYDRVEIDPEKGEAFFCSEEEARMAGFRRSRR